MNEQVRLQLARDINAAIRKISWPTTYHEPDYVAQLVMTLPGAIQSSLRMLLPTRNIIVGGAFIHQKPLAHFINPPMPGLRDPELGDLLIVCREKRAPGYVYNAQLLQAKVVDDIFHTVIPMDHQFILYSQWPVFEYRRAGSLNGTRRSVCPKTITQGAQYLMIEKSDPSEMFTATVDNPLEGTTCFPCELASVIAFDRGRTFQSGYPCDSWSRYIWDLLRISASAVFNRRHAGFKKAPRWSRDSVLDFILEKSPNGDIPVIEQIGDNDGVSGVSVICVDIGPDPQAIQ